MKRTIALTALVTIAIVITALVSCNSDITPTPPYPCPPPEPLTAFQSPPSPPPPVDYKIVQIGGVDLILLVLGLVEAAKRLKVTGDNSFRLALALGTIFMALSRAIALDLIPAVALPYIDVIFYGLGGGLAATGLYDFVKKLSNKG